jgi:hypothetical protein
LRVLACAALLSGVLVMSVRQRAARVTAQATRASEV